MRSLTDQSGPPVEDRQSFVAVEGQPKYLTVYEFEHARVSESDTWSRARVSNPWTRRVQPHLRHDEGSPGVYQRVSPK